MTMKERFGASLEVTPNGHRLVTPHPEIYYDF